MIPYFLNIIETVVPAETLDSINTLCSKLSQILLTIYNPIPVDSPKLRPFSPVKTDQNSFSIFFDIPTPLSITLNLTAFSSS